MSLDIRENIIKNFKGNTKNEIRETIAIATSGKDELILPGLGVLFEIVWNELPEEKQDELINIIHNKIN